MFLVSFYEKYVVMCMPGAFVYKYEHDTFVWCLSICMRLFSPCAKVFGVCICVRLFSLCA